jgi:hypothetical protein
MDEEVKQGIGNEVLSQGWPSSDLDHVLGYGEVTIAWKVLRYQVEPNRVKQ